jgi:hypothetical protein
VRVQPNFALSIVYVHSLGCRICNVLSTLFSETHFTVYFPQIFGYE